MTKLALCTPWDSPFTWREPMRDLVRLACYFRRPGWALDFFMGRGWCPARRHADMCEQALAWGADFILILGADQTYDTDLIERLVRRYEATRGIIAAMVPMRGYVDWQPMRPFQPLAFRAPYTDADDTQCAVIHREDGDFVRANIIGTGVVLFHTGLLTHLKKPWFAEHYDRETWHRTADMDSGFLTRLQRETGTFLYVDTTIRVGHKHDFTIDDSFQQRFADWADPTTPDVDRAICRFRAELPHVEVHRAENKE